MKTLTCACGEKFESDSADKTEAMIIQHAMKNHSDMFATMDVDTLAGIIHQNHEDLKKG
jgi:hypothetical protein